MVEGVKSHLAPEDVPVPVVQVYAHFFIVDSLPMICPMPTGMVRLAFYSKLSLK